MCCGAALKQFITVGSKIQFVLLNLLHQTLLDGGKGKLNANVKGSSSCICHIKETLLK